MLAWIKRLFGIADETTNDGEDGRAYGQGAFAGKGGKGGKGRGGKGGDAIVTGKGARAFGGKGGDAT